MLFKILDSIPLHQESLENNNTMKNGNISHMHPNHFSDSSLNLICEGARNVCESNGHEIEELPNVEETCELIYMVAKDLKQICSLVCTNLYRGTELRRTMHY